MISYIGGKSKIGKWIVPFYPKDMETYVEGFSGMFWCFFNMELEHYPNLKNIKPANNPIIKNSLKKFNFSFKNKKPRKTANKIEVSLTEETTAIGRYKHAHTTIP